MNTLRITTNDNRTWFKPGSSISGSVSWVTEDQVEHLELRLFWYTSGKGSEEAEIVDRLSVVTPEPSGERRFSFKAPEGPYSFSGRLITLRWALELVLEPSKDVERLDLIVSPRPVEVDIRHIREL